MKLTSRILAALAFLFLFPIFAQAQTTLTSATVTDSNGQAFINGTYSIAFFTNGLPGPFFLNGAPFNAQTVFAGNLDVTGSFTNIPIPSNTSITPSGTSWSFTVCPQANSNCYTTPIKITGTSLNVSAFITPPPIQVNANPKAVASAYQDSEIVGPVVGYTYFNLTSQTLRTCTVAIPCTWVAVGSGGGGGGGSGLAFTCSVPGNGSAVASTTWTCTTNFGTQSVIADCYVGGVLSSSFTLTPTSANVVTVNWVNPTSGYCSIMGGGVYIGPSVPPAVFGNVSFQGPRPWIDVTAYGAKGDGSTDDTASINAAIAAACTTTIGGFQVTPVVYFPPGIYNVAQPQTPSTTSPINILCAVELQGGGGVTPQFQTQPSVDIEAIQGGSPNSAPLIMVGTPSGTTIGVTFNHVFLDAWNQAVQLYQTGNIRFQDTYLRVHVTGSPDNAPLVEINCLWTFYNGGGMGFNSATPSTFKNLYDVEWLGVANAQGDITYLQFFTNVTMFGGGFLYDQRATATNGIPSQFHLLNISLEDSANPFLSVISSTSTPAGMSAVEMDHSLIEDSLATSPQANFYWNQNATASGIYINNSATGQGGPSIVQQQGTVSSWFVLGCNNNCSQQAVDGSGNPIGGGLSQTASGFDFTSTASDSRRLQTNYFQPWTAQVDGLPIRLFSSGSGGFATSGLDGTLGVLFGDGLSNGWTGQVVQSSKNTLDIGFSTTLPPTAVTATPAAGGTLPNGTYYYFVSPEFSASGCSTAFTGAPSLLSAGATTSGSNNTVNISWTLPPTAPATLTGFCVFRSANAGSYNSQTGLYVSGASTTSAIDTGSSFSTVGSGIEINHMQSAYHFTPTYFQTQGLLPEVIYSAAGTPLPSCVSGITGMQEVVSDATSPTYNGTYTSGGSVKIPVFCNGSNWVTH
jgi:Pectate lyase superfamily protein